MPKYSHIEFKIEDIHMDGEHDVIFHRDNGETRSARHLNKIESTILLAILNKLMKS
jgi:hypothetical protein